MVRGKAAQNKRKGHALSDLLRKIPSNDAPAAGSESTYGTYAWAVCLHRSQLDRHIVCFAAILIGIMTGGTLWIMFDLLYRMMN
jgi:hypothetical protein